MADEREHGQGSQGGVSGGAANEDKVQTGGREANAAQPLNAGGTGGGPERYPSVRQDDSVEATGRDQQGTGETRSFDASADAPTPEETPTTAEGDLPVSANDGRLGPGADPVEGKR